MKRVLFAALFVCIAMAQNAPAETIYAAAAANFIKPLQKIAAQYEKETGNKVVISAGSSGKLYAQISNGAPFDLFFSADREKVEKLVNDGFAVKDSARLYAYGKLALYSAKPSYIGENGSILTKGGFKHIAIADAKLAPYGAAAKQVLDKLGILTRLEPLMVQGESIAQTYQFIASGAAELGFIAYSQVKEIQQSAIGSYWLVPQSLYDPIDQWACILTKSKANTAVRDFLTYVTGSKAAGIIESFGYGLPK